jgi:hypothetical protein
LTDLEPRFIRYGGAVACDYRPGTAIIEPGAKFTLVKVDSLSEAQGIKFQCPTCKIDYPGEGFHKIILPFRGRGVAAEINGGHTWEVSGSSYGDLTLKPSVNAAGGACRWHGFVTNGEVT